MHSEGKHYSNKPEKIHSRSQLLLNNTTRYLEFLNAPEGLQGGGGGTEQR